MLVEPGYQKSTDAALANGLAPVWIPPWLPNETLYSWCSRYHRVAGGPRASSTCMRLFDHPRAGLSHDVPGRVGTLASRAGGRLGSANEILLSRTVVGYYMRLRPIAEARVVLEQLTNTGVRGLKARLGWLATRFGAAHPLRACSQCLEEDLRRHEVALWRLAHQLPGVWACSRHGQRLWATPLKANGLQRFQWLLPDDLPSTARTALSDGAWEASARSAKEVAAATATFVRDWRQPPLEHVKVAAAVLARLVELGLATSSGRLKSSSLSNEFAQHLRTYREWPEASALCVGSDAALCVLRRVLDVRERPLHPLRYIVTVLWLFESWAAFERAYDTTVERSSATEGVAPQLAQTSTGPRDAFFQHVHRGCTVSAAARLSGIDAETGLTWAAQAGMTIHRRPKVLVPSTRKLIERALAQGKPKASIARAHDVSIVTVTRVLRSCPKLQGERNQSIFKMQQSKARRQLTTCLARHPEQGVNQLRTRCPAAYMWLYRHDRTWLREQLVTLPPRERHQATRVDWALRDQAFARAVEALKHERTPDGAGANSWTPMDLIRAVPALRSKMRHLAKMPLTVAALGLPQFQKA